MSYCIVLLMLLVSYSNPDWVSCSYSDNLQHGLHQCKICFQYRNKTKILLHKFVKHNTIGKLENKTTNKIGKKANTVNQPELLDTCNQRTFQLLNYFGSVHNIQAKWAIKFNISINF